MSMMSEIHAAMTESGEIARVEELHDTIDVFDERIVRESHIGPAWVALLQRARSSVIAEIDELTTAYGLQIAGA